MVGVLPYFIAAWITGNPHRPPDAALLFGAFLHWFVVGFLISLLFWRRRPGRNDPAT